MIIHDIMRKQVITLTKETTIGEAVNQFRIGDFRHIPIVNDENELIGIISDRDIRDALPSVLSQTSQSDILNQTIEKIMTTNVITCTPFDFVEEMATYFYHYKIGCIPVTSSEKLVGLVTEIDVLHTLVTLTGAYQPSSQLEILVKNQPGILNEVVSIFSGRNINIVSVLVYPASDEQHKVLVFRIQTMNPFQVISELKQAGYNVLYPNEMSVQ
jgi:acetoin utilization protein AcuB